MAKPADRASSVPSSFVAIDPATKKRIATPSPPDPKAGGEAILVAVAWPYANGDLHLGHIAGSLLPPDIFARYHRMKGDRVLMVSGSDCHGTPILLTAEKEGVDPATVVDRYNARHLQALEDFGIAFDLFTKTSTDNHREHVQDIFRTLLEHGYMEQRTADAPYDPNAQRFLPDRYVEGTCPHCKYTNARGDQCDECGKTLDPHELIDPHPKGEPSGSIEFRATEHYYFLLSKLQDRLAAWVDEVAEPRGWRNNTVNFTKNWLSEGLKDRPITRDLTWGVPLPIPGLDDKRIYVWFEAVCGYFTAAVEWAQNQTEAGAANITPDSWKTWWENPATKSYYFLGKDNIPFHSIIWPAILTSYSDGREARGEPRLVLPYDVPANEFLNLDGQQFSKSRGIGIWVPDITSRFDPDVVRYYLSVNMPENRDANWTWEDFVSKVNDELVDTFGNLAHRALTFTHKHFGKVPECGVLTPAEEDLLEKIAHTHARVTEDLEAVRLKSGIRNIMALAQEGNRYFADQKPWALVKEDKARAGTVLHTTLRLVRALAIMLAPYTPFSSDRLWTYLGERGSIHTDAAWPLAREDIVAGQALEEPAILYRKLDLAEILGDDTDPSPKPKQGGKGGNGKTGEGGKAKAGKGGNGQPGKAAKSSKPPKETKIVADDNGQITIDDFAQVDLRIARIIKVEDHPNADKLYVLTLDAGTLGERQVCAGLKEHYAPGDMEGKLVAFVANLKPAKLRGVESQGMILAGDAGDTVAFLSPEKELELGAKIR